MSNKIQRVQNQSSLDILHKCQFINQIQLMRYYYTQQEDVFLNLCSIIRLSHVHYKIHLSNMEQLSFKYK
ncbi:hypothetical protein pb186bvf_014481 [Paramecium bursaria]